MDDINWKVGWNIPVSNPSRDLYEIDIYFNMQDEACRKFGTDTLLLYQMGKFYEVYGREENEHDQRRVNAFAECCNLSDGAHKSTGIPKHRYQSPPRMLGFTDKALDKFRALLLNAGWTLVIVSECPGSTTAKLRTRTLRQITEIVSGATHEDNVESSYTVASIYLEEIPSNKSILYYSMGVATMNTATGKASLHEITETKAHISDYLHRLLLTFDPNEIIWNEVAAELLELSSYRTRRIEVDKKHTSIQWIYDNLLCRVVSMKPSRYNYKDRQRMNRVLGIPESIRSSEPFTALAMILSTLLEQSSEVVSSIHFMNESSHCVLYGNAIEQLSIFPKKTYEARVQSVPSQRQLESRRWNSLFTLMDACSTRFGSRQLHYRLSHPSLDRAAIENSHRMVGQLIEDNKYKKIRSMISKSIDGERVARRFETAWKINPGLIGSMYRFLETWSALDMYCKKQVQQASSEVPEETWEQLLEYFRNTLSIDALFQNRASRWEVPICPESELVQETETQEKKWDLRIQYLKQIMEIKSEKSIKLCSNDSDGYTVQIPKKKSAFFVKWKKNPGSNQDPLLLELCDASVKHMASNGRLFHPAWKLEWQQVLALKDRIHEENRVFMKQWRDDFWEQWGGVVKTIIQWSADIDVWSTFAHISANYGYHCPTIVEADKTVIEGKELRHPMIERIQEDVAGYVANDVDLNDTKRGMLLYGMNASGKSSYMKSVGLALIMSQAGCWVPSKQFKHSIVSKLFTRISGNDDYMRGKSSFALEMEELSTILQTACDKSIVLGDELCRGTEQVSGTAIVGAGVHSLLQKDVAFVFATHLHDLPHLSILQPVIGTSLGVYHLRVMRDVESDSLIYERSLQEGQGSTLYGLEVANALGMDKSTYDIANSIREELLGYEQKTSRYNVKKQIKVCEVCGEKPAVETHHIKEQQDANEHSLVDGSTRLHSVSNLVGICESCHTDHHTGKKKIVGWKETTTGRKLIVL